MTSVQSADQDMKVIQKLYAGINEYDVDLFVGILDNNVIRSEFEEIPTTVSFRGKEELKKNLTGGRSQWAEGACTPTEWTRFGDKLLVTVHVKVRLKDQTEWIDGQVIDGFSVKNGLIAEFHSFNTKEKAQVWASR